MPFPPKKPEDEKPAAKPAAPGEKPAFGKPAAPAGEKPAPGAPGESPAKQPAFGKPAAPGAPGEKPAAPGDPSAPKAPGAPAPAGGDGAKPKAGGGNSAPETPGQGVPDRKQAEEAGKAEPEGDNAPLPKEANEAKKAAAEQPKGLASVATLTKTEAETATKANGQPDAAMTQMMTIIESMAKLIKAQQGGMGSNVGGGNTQAIMGAAKTGMMPKPGMGAKPGMPGRPGQPMARPGMAPGAGGMGMGAGAPIPKQLTMEQINGMMGIIEAANSGRIPRQGAALVLASGFGIPPEVAMQMVSPDAAPEAAQAPGVPGVPGEEPEVDEEGNPIEAINPEEEEMEEGEEFEGDPEEEGEPVAAAPPEEDHTGFTYGKYHRRDAAGAADPFDVALARLVEKRRDVKAKMDALEYARAVVEGREDDWDEAAHPRDESGRFGEGGGGGTKNEKPGGRAAKVEKSQKPGGTVPHESLDPLWRPKNPGPEPKEKVRAPAKVFERDARAAEAAGDRVKAERLFKLAAAVKGERDVVKARIREEVKLAAKNGAPKAHPATPAQGSDDYFKTNAHPDNIKKLRDPQAKSIKYLGGGVNDTMKITMHDGSKATWKPKGGEAPYMRGNVPAGTYYVREAAASNLARVLGVQDLVPAVVAFHEPTSKQVDKFGIKGEHGPFGPPKEGEEHDITRAREAGVAGSLHAWAPGEAIMDMYDVPDMNRDAVERARVFDYITGNSDRHGKNMLVNSRDGDHYPVLIDNGLSFNTGGVPDRVIFPKETLRWNGLLDSTRTMIKSIDVKEVAKTLKKSGLDRDASKLTVQRVLRLQADPDYLDSEGLRSPKFVWRDSYDSGAREEREALAVHADLAEKHIAAYDGDVK